MLTPVALGLTSGEAEKEELQLEVGIQEGGRSRVGRSSLLVLRTRSPLTP